MKTAICILTATLGLSLANTACGGPKGTLQVPRRTSPITIDGDFSDWPLASYTTISQQPEFPDGQGVGISTDASGDHLVWNADRVGPFNGTDLSNWEPDSASEFGSSVYMAYDEEFLYVLGVFIDDELNGIRGADGFSNFLNDGFEIFVDAKGDSNDWIAELSFPEIDQEFPNEDDFQFTFGLNEAFEPSPKGPDDLGAEVHMERAGDPEIVKALYLDIRDATDLSSVGGRDVAAKSYTDLRVAGAQNPEILADPDTTFTGYAVEFVLPFGLVDGFTPDHLMGFDLFWRDVDDDLDPQPGFGSSGIFWTDWGQATEVSNLGEDGNLFHAGNWGQLEFVASPGLAGDFNADGVLDATDIDDLTAQWPQGNHPPTHDLTNDGLVNEQDVRFWIRDLFESWVGDANLDGEFNSSDLVVVLSAGTYEAQVDASWSTGDFNGDGRANSSDLVAALTDGGYELGPRAAVAAVPEPHSLAILSLGFAVVAPWYCRGHCLRRGGQ